MSVEGLPLGWNASFEPNPVTVGESTTLSITPYYYIRDKFFLTVVGTAALTNHRVPIEVSCTDISDPNFLRDGQGWNAIGSVGIVAPPNTGVQLGSDPNNNNGHSELFQAFDVNDNILTVQWYTTCTTGTLLIELAYYANQTAIPQGVYQFPCGSSPNNVIQSLPISVASYRGQILYLIFQWGPSDAASTVTIFGALLSST